MQRNFRRVWLTTIVSIIVTSGSASAQDTPAPASQPIAEPASQPVTDEPPEEVVGGEEQVGPVVTTTTSASGQKAVEQYEVVTGSRIRRKDLTGPAPVIVFSREQILASGRSNVGEFLQNMPEQSNAINRGTNNAGDGSIRVNLRGIGPQSTLVLLNGRRLAPGGTGADASVDFSSIPTNVIERIEVLKDGASAVYGSDAIAGVVNIITKKRYNGAEANIYGSGTTYGDGQQIDINGVVGTSNDKGGVLLSMGYYNGAPVWAGNRDFSTIQRGFDMSGGGPGEAYELGSGTVPGTYVVTAANQRGVPNGNAFYNNLARSYPTAPGFTRDASGNWREFRGSNLPSSGGDGYNFQPYNYLLTPQQRFNVFSSGDYQLGRHVRTFFDAFYTKRNSAQTLAPEPLNLDQEGVTVSAQNLYNPFGRDLPAVRRRLVEFGRRTFQQDINNFHLTAGIDGSLPDSAGPLAGWFWEAAFNYNLNESTELKTGSLRVTRLRDAVGPSFIDATGAPRCGTPGAPIDGCVPLNLFGGPGSITQDQVNGLTFTGVQRGFNQLIGAQANTSGDLFHLWSKRAVGLALGYEFRSLSGGQFPDPVTVAGETTGNKGLITQGSYLVNEIYGELNIPIVEKIPALEALELVLAGRGSFYSNFGNTFNWKVGGRWSPTQDFALRGTYSTAFRAPSIPELYQGNTDNFASVTDPCRDVPAGSALERNCGAAANNGDTQNQLRSSIGGNARLTPERAQIFTVGLVVQPRWVKNLSLTFDYFNTTITDTITSLGENVILQGCYPAADGIVPKYCGFIQRDPASQLVNRITNLNVNAGQDKLDGIDMSGNYDLNTVAGTFNFFAAVAYLHSYDRTLADGSVLHGAGTYDLNQGGVAGAFPHFRFNAGISWALKGFSAGIRTYFIGSYKECGDADGDLQGAGLCSVADHVGERMVDAYNTWDLVVGYSFKTAVGRTSLSLGSTNIFNAAPPRVYNGFATTTDTYTYDMAMRQVYARVSQAF